MIKVTHVIHLSEDPGKLVFSGAENHLIVLLKGLAKKGVDVELIAMVNRFGDTLSKKFEELRAAGVTVTVFNKPKKRSWKFLFLYRLEWNWELKKILDQRKDRLIHLHLDPVFMVAAALFARPKGIFLTIHADDPSYNRADYRFWLHFIHRRINAIVAISNHVRSHVAKAAMVSESSIRLIYYGYPEPLAGKPRNLLRAAFNLPQDKYIIGFIGRLTSQKNIGVFIRALSKLPDALGVIVGTGEERSRLEKLVKDLNVGNVRFLGSQPNGYELISMFDAFCLPSVWEGLGLVLIEAMFQKVPIVGSRQGAIPEILGDGAYGKLFDPTNPDELTGAIQRSIQDVAETRKVAEKAYDYARSQFGLDRMVNETIAVYERA